VGEVSAVQENNTKTKRAKTKVLLLDYRSGSLCKKSMKILNMRKGTDYKSICGEAFRYRYRPEAYLKNHTHAHTHSLQFGNPSNFRNCASP
jgi:hypothetical protein